MASLHERHLPYADGSANMAKTYYEPDEKGRMRITESKGSKKPIKLARGFVKIIEDVPFVSEQELNKAINIISKN